MIAKPGQCRGEHPVWRDRASLRAATGREREEPVRLLSSTGRSSTRRATLREISSSRMARLSADDKAVRITCTVRIDRPAARWPLKKAYTRKPTAGQAGSAQVRV
jgi:hypothetical protein